MLDIEKLLNDHLKKRDEDRANRKGSGKWKPSGFGQCYRRQWYSKIGEKPTNPPDERTKRVFLAGEVFHTMIQDLIEEKQVEVLIEDEDFKGYADIVTEDCVLDIKSQHSRSFWYMAKSTNILEDKKENWLQVGFYATKLGKPLCGLVFVSKDDLCIKQYVLPVEKIKPALNTEITVLKGIKELPDPIPRMYLGKNKFVESESGKKEKVPTECAYCNFRYKCQKEEK